MIKKIINKIKENRWVLRSIIPTIYFNFHYLPFRQAIKLPIFLYKPHLKLMKGTITIHGGATTGMIRLGKNQVSIYPNSGIMLELRGKIVFNGRCSIGNNSYITTGNKSIIEIGKNFSATTTLRLVCYDHIRFNDNVLIGWNCLFMDTDFHRLTRSDGKRAKGYGPISIGCNTWIANGCRIMKNTMVPDNTVIAAYTVLAGKVDAIEKTVIGNEHKSKVLARERWLDIDDMEISYE